MQTSTPIAYLLNTQECQEKAQSTAKRMRKTLRNFEVLSGTLCNN